MIGARVIDTRVMNARVMDASRLLTGGAIALWLLASCSTAPPIPKVSPEVSPEVSAPAAQESLDNMQNAEMTTSSRITAVEMTKMTPDGSGYRFAVTVESDETGCDRYADWWEVVTPEGELLYRRILAHSHVDEQPFTRSGGPVEIEEDDVVIVRSHVNSDGYSTQAMKGSASEGFSSVVLESGFAANLENADPQPNDCSF